MKNKGTWSLELDTSGVLTPGRWLWLRAVLWAALPSAGALGFLFSTIDLTGWLNQPPNSSYITFLVLPLLAFLTYPFIVRLAEVRTPVEVLPSAGTLSELIVGAAIGFITLCFTTVVLWSLDFLRGGLVTGLLYMVSGRLWTSIGVHTAWDFIEDFVLGVDKRSGLLRTTLGDDRWDSYLYRDSMGFAEGLFYENADRNVTNIAE